MEAPCSSVAEQVLVVPGLTKTIASMSVTMLNNKVDMTSQKAAKNLCATCRSLREAAESVVTTIDLCTTLTGSFTVEVQLEEECHAVLFVASRSTWRQHYAELKLTRLIRMLPSRDIKHFATELNDDGCVESPFYLAGLRTIVHSDDDSCGLKQFYIDIGREEWKLDTLCDLYETLTITQAIIYCNTRRKVDWLADKLQQCKYSFSILHEDMNTRERDIVLREVQNGACRVLITTGMMHYITTGMMRPSVDHGRNALLINYDLPIDIDNYVWRTKCMGRVDPEGVVINLVVDKDVRMLRDIEQFYEAVVREMPMDVADLLLNLSIRQ